MKQLYFISLVLVFIFRYKSLSLLIGKEFYVLWLYLKKAFILFKMCTYIKIYLFKEKIQVDIGFHFPLVKFAGLYQQMKELLVLTLDFNKYICILLAPSEIGISFSQRPSLFGIELAYSHNLFFRLFVAKINPVFLLITLSISLVLFMSSFYYEYSYLSIFCLVRSSK